MLLFDMRKMYFIHVHDITCKRSEAQPLPPHAKNIKCQDECRWRAAAQRSVRARRLAAVFRVIQRGRIRQITQICGLFLT